MKKLIGYEGKTARKMEYIEKIFDADDKAALTTVFDGDPYEMTLGDVISGYLECVFGLPKALLDKPLVDLNENDISILDKLGDDLVVFSRN